MSQLEGLPIEMKSEDTTFHSSLFFVFTILFVSRRIALGLNIASSQVTKYLILMVKCFDLFKFALHTKDINSIHQTWQK